MRKRKEAAQPSTVLEMKERKGFCHACREQTMWKLAKGGKSLRCEVCGDRLPCARPCSHLDCEVARREIGQAE
jgi:LSD1 subclass zinc finger protein